MKLITTDGVRVSRQIKRALKNTDLTQPLTAPSGGAVTKQVLPDKNQTKPKTRAQAISTQQTVDLYFALFALVGAVERTASIAQRARDALREYEPEVDSLADCSIEEKIF